MNAPSGTGSDFRLGVAVAIVAAITATADLANGRLGDDELIAVSERTSAYMWHQAKSIKGASAEGRHLTLKALFDAGALPAVDAQKINASISAFHADAERLEQEKKAILQGGTIDGVVVQGAGWWDQRARGLGRAGDILDVALLLLHMALLLGGVGIASQDARLEKLLYRVVLGAGVLGVVIALVGVTYWLISVPNR